MTEQDVRIAGESRPDFEIEAFTVALRVGAVAGRVLPRGRGEASLTPAETERLECFAPVLVAKLQERMGVEAGLVAAYTLAEAITAVHVPGAGPAVVARLVEHVAAAKEIAERAVVAGADALARADDAAERIDALRIDGERRLAAWRAYARALHDVARATPPIPLPRLDGPVPPAWRKVSAAATTLAELGEHLP